MASTSTSSSPIRPRVRRSGTNSASRRARSSWHMSQEFDPMKDHQSFLAAMTELPHVQAMLIGAGSKDLRAGSNIMCLGGRDDVPRLLAAADVVVSSSAFGEGFSNAIAEGMACGLPAVATAVGDAHLIVGDTGLVVPPSNPACARRRGPVVDGRISGGARRARRARASAYRRAFLHGPRRRTLRGALCLDPGLRERSWVTISIRR